MYAEQDSLFESNGNLRLSSYRGSIPGQLSVS